MAAPFVSFAQTAATGTVVTVATTTATATTVVDAGFVPGDFFYFLDRWTEALNITFTFNKEKKARKHLEYAKERVAEMSEVLKKPEAKLDDVASAKENFDAQVADAAALVKSEKESGADVAGLARELDDELTASHDALKSVFKEHKDRSSRAEEELRSKLSSLSSDDPQVQGLTQALESVTKEKGDAMKEEVDLDTNLMDEQATFDEVMGKEVADQKNAENAARLRDRIEQEASIGTGTSSSGSFMNNDAAESTNSNDLGESRVNNLEQEIKKGEKALEEFDR